MKLNRRKLQRAILDQIRPEDIAAVLTNISEEISLAQSKNQPDYAEMLESDYWKIFEKWCGAVKTEKSQVFETLIHHKSMLNLKLNWFQELIQIVEIPEIVSDVQAEILKNTSLAPRNWTEAKEAIQLLPDFRFSVGTPLEIQIRVIYECLDALAAAVAANQSYIEQIHHALEHPSRLESQESLVPTHLMHIQMLNLDIQSHQMPIQEYLDSLAMLEELED